MKDHLSQGNFYTIKLRETLLPGRAGWFNHLTVTPLAEGGMQLSGWFPDQPALRGLLEQLWDLNLTIRSLEQIEEGDSEDISPSKVEK